MFFLETESPPIHRTILKSSWIFECCVTEPLDFVPFSEFLLLIPGDVQLGETHAAPSLSALCGRSDQYCLLVLSGTVLTATDLEVALCILQFRVNLEKNVSI